MIQIYECKYYTVKIIHSKSLNFEYNQSEIYSCDILN